tara:strand:+ start:187 stop:960 length:774 start_codon:yes stop_codon:yes gene_type:complete
MDLYEILNVNKKSSKQEIKKSYYKLAKKFHPDRFTGSDNEFKKINFAYQILSDDNLRNNYDSNNKEDLYDIFQSIIKKNNLGIVNDFFSFIYQDSIELKNDINKLNLQKIYKKLKSKGKLDISTTVNINIEDIYFNKKIDVTVKRLINNNFYNFNLDLDIDIYDEELKYDNFGDEILFIKGDLILKLNILKEKNYHILDNFNLLVETNNLNFKLFDKIDISNLALYYNGKNYKVYILEGYGFYNKEFNKNGDLLIKI